MNRLKYDAYVQHSDGEHKIKNKFVFLSMFDKDEINKMVDGHVVCKNGKNYWLEEAMDYRTGFIL